MHCIYCACKSNSMSTTSELSCMAKAAPKTFFPQEINDGLITEKIDLAILITNSSRVWCASNIRWRLASSGNNLHAQYDDLLHQWHYAPTRTVNASKRTAGWIVTFHPVAVCLLHVGKIKSTVTPNFIHIIWIRRTTKHAKLFSTFPGYSLKN